MDTIKVGEIWKCIKTVHMENSGEIAYVSGNIYKCEIENCITDEEGHKKHKISDRKFLAEHFEKLTKNAYTDFKPGQVLKRTKEGDGSTWLLRKDKQGFLRIKSKLGDPAWCTSMLRVVDEDNYELASPIETAWFEHCEKNRAYISFEDFKKLPINSNPFKVGDIVDYVKQPTKEDWLDVTPVIPSWIPGVIPSWIPGKHKPLRVSELHPKYSHIIKVENYSLWIPACCFKKVASTVSLSTSKLGFQPGDKVEFFRQPESFEWDGIGEIPISFYIGQVLEVCFHDPIRGSLGVIEHSSRAYPASCFRKVEFSSMSYPEIEPTPVNEPPYSTFEVGDKVYFYSRWLGYELGLNFDSHFKLDGTTTYTVTATRENGKFIRFANGCTVDAKYLKKVEGSLDYPRWFKSDQYYYYYYKPNFYIIRADTNFKVEYRCEHLDGALRSMTGEKPISSYELEQLSTIPIYVGNKVIWEQIEDLSIKYPYRPDDIFKPQKKDLPDLHKTEKSATFDTEIERVKDLSNIKLFKPFKNRYS